MTYEQTLEWMFGQLPMYQERGKTAYTSKLDNIIALATHLGEPQNQFKSIHVGGTNGKGSSSHMLASILQEAGYRVGLYTSPHLKDFRERIRINGEMTSKEFVVGFIGEHKKFLEGNSLSFFEMTVGMAFDYFAREKVDMAIIEVGLGGRLDSTNIIRPEISLITNIGWDHTDILGDDLVLITKEKAGIIKNQVPVVISEYQEETAPVFEKVASQKGSPLVFAPDVVTKEYKTELLGTYQAQNIKGVVATLQQLDGFDVLEEHIEKGLLNVVRNTGLLGRWQILEGLPKVICDTAHNKEGMIVVMDQLLSEDYENLHMVLGFVQDKNLDVILPLLPKKAKYYLARPNIRRGLNADDLLRSAEEYDLDSLIYESVPEALLDAKKNADEHDVIFVGGSTFTVAEVL